ncbi:Glycosyltransferase family 4 protein OS=Streptomyces tendae OX=1932 GN=F3L20_04260 PE=4 SV=1 [Streptomyces tendae]
MSAVARRRLSPGRDRTVEVFTSMPMADVPPGVTVRAHTFAWTRDRFGPPRVTQGADLVGTSLVETGVVDADAYVRAVGSLARTHGAALLRAPPRDHREAAPAGRGDRPGDRPPRAPVELVARRGPVGRTVVSFPSTVVHTLPLALAGTGVRIAVCDIDPAWLTAHASPRAQGFLSGVTGSARDVHRLSAVTAVPVV